MTLCASNYDQAPPGYCMTYNLTLSLKVHYAFDFNRDTPYVYTVLLELGV